jgi:tRNA threonylcarbamoyladenosine modification (KEOPS) complex Cgi121 subunit
MTTYEITVDGKHAARVTVKHDIEMCTHVAAIRRIWDTPNVEIIDGEKFVWYDDVEEGGVDIRSQIVRMS